MLWLLWLMICVQDVASLTAYLARYTSLLRPLYTSVGPRSLPAAGLQAS